MNEETNWDERERDGRRVAIGDEREKDREGRKGWGEKKVLRSP